MDFTLERPVVDGKRYVSRQAIDEMGKRQTPKGVPDDYGLGWWVSDTAMGHGGAYGTDTKIYRKNGYVVQFYVLGAGLPKQGDAMSAFEAAVKGLYELE